MHPTRRAGLLLTCATLAATTGCATIVHGTTQRIPITSTPPGAAVLVDSVAVGVTPLVATVSRKRPHVVSVRHDSATVMDLALERNVSPWIMGNFLLYIVPLQRDFSNGAAYGFVSDTIRVDFAAGTVSPALLVRPGARRSTRMPADSRATVTAMSAVVGFGSGHRIIGEPAARYAREQLLGLGLATVGLGCAFAGSICAPVGYAAGIGLFAYSRVSEVADVSRRMAAYGR